MISRWPTTLVMTAALGMVSLALPSLAFAQNAAAPNPSAQTGATMAPGNGDDGQDRHGWLTKEDRAAFLAARIAAVHAGLALTPDQEKLWPAAETAIRDGIKQLHEERHKIHEEKSADDTADRGPIARLRRMAEIEQVRASVFGKIADASQPLYASLTPDQKRRLHILMHVMHAHHEAMMERHWDRDQDHDHDQDQDK